MKGRGFSNSLESLNFKTAWNQLIPVSASCSGGANIVPCLECPVVKQAVFQEIAFF